MEERLGHGVVVVEGRGAEEGVVEVWPDAQLLLPPRVDLLAHPGLQDLAACGGVGELGIRSWQELDCGPSVALGVMSAATVGGGEGKR